MAELKLNQEMIDKAADGIRNGNYAKTVYQALGISNVTYYAWLRKGAEWQEGDEPLYLNFYHTIKKAEAEGEQELLNIIKTAAKRNWTAAAWMLERMHPDEYGRRERITHEGSEDKPLTVKWKMTNPGGE